MTSPFIFGGKVDITYIDLSLLYFEEKGKSKVMDTEVDRTINDTTIQDSAAKMEEDREVMLRDLQETVYSSLNVISDKCKIRFNDIEKHHGANFHRSKKKRKEANLHWCPCGKSKGNETEVYTV